MLHIGRQNELRSNASCISRPSVAIILSSLRLTRQAAASEISAATLARLAMSMTASGSQKTEIIPVIYPRAADAHAILVSAPQAQESRNAALLGRISYTQRADGECLCRAARRCHFIFRPTLPGAARRRLSYRKNARSLEHMPKRYTAGAEDIILKVMIPPSALTQHGHILSRFCRHFSMMPKCLSLPFEKRLTAS